MIDTHITNAKIDPVVEEQLWVSRLRQGDETAVGALIGRHRARLLRTAGNILREQNDAEDVVQEAFIRAFREIHRLREDQAFAGFLYRICIRLCMDKLRSRKAAPAECDLVEESEGARIENRLLIQKLLKSLSPDLRITLVLREVEQFSYEEISAITHVPVGTVRSRLHAAREKFRDLWMNATGGIR